MKAKDKAKARAKKRDPELFLNRELSWLEFNGRVLEEAMDPTNPLLERLKFVTIVCSNLDEFFMVRVAALKNAVEEGDTGPDAAGLSPGQQLEHIALRAHEMIRQLYEALGGEILPALSERGIRLLGVDGLDAGAQAALGRHFRDEILPALTPMAIEASRPFPFLSSLSLNLAVFLGPGEGEERPRLAVVQVPAKLPRLVRPQGQDGTSYVLVEDVIRAELRHLFPGQQVLEAAAFRIARDAEMDLDDEGGRDFIQAVEEELRKRRKGHPVRLEVEAGAGEDLVALLTERVEVEAQDVYRIPGPLDPRPLLALVELPALEDLRDPPLKPLAALEPPEMERIFEVLEERDVLLHHPYES
ncbi:MAG TPA: RNA degradosome polyphosphate kinase, partial [Vicinamibacteria bacterium]